MVRRWTYLTLSLAMALPVLLWPALWLRKGLFHPALNFPLLWSIAAALLLVCAVTADSVLFFRTSGKGVLAMSVWMSGGLFWSLLAVQHPQGAWLIAVAFVAHALRSGCRLWRGDDRRWWLWPAWWRDMLTATGMFAWLSVLAHV
ncbi:MAG: hypothetical protein D6678_03490 [Zetaproteobacteria bacterium]|nr:MAG: hypothetical protein D6678_03490 [Zetaproteobacteria bacterium]